ncbi:expressed unknown protein [Seminavis robusta]|uniref:Uncharacterized protein n=1 Tax=Seminavis robusta TaxID=568900 RepID=A0A9N8EMY0_9STRA|nr:expressed unknown protein [Seminavis robusta]|eukprot:Sro1249_g255951.1  (151) ;mRNA; f:2486-2938
MQMWRTKNSHAEPSINAAMHHRVREGPPCSEQRGGSFGECLCFGTKETIIRDDKQSKVGALRETGLEMFAFLIALAIAKDLVRIFATMRSSIKIDDMNINYAVSSMLPEATDKETASFLGRGEKCRRVDGRQSIRRGRTTKMDTGFILAG